MLARAARERVTSRSVRRIADCYWLNPEPGSIMSQRLRILVIGASGDLGRAIVAELAPRHDIVTAGSKSGDIRIDIADPEQHRRGAQGGRARSTRSSAPRARSISTRSRRSSRRRIEQSSYGLGLTNKLMGQVNLALAARDHLSDGGSITLITGVTADAPIATGSSASMVNGALEAFVMAAAIEMPRGIRINVVSPTVFEESMDGLWAVLPRLRSRPGRARRARLQPQRRGPRDRPDLPGATDAA